MRESKAAVLQSIGYLVGVIVLAAAFAFPAAAQMQNGPPSTTTIGGHFLAPPPSVLSVSGRSLPPPVPSVTSLPNIGFANQAHVRRVYRSGRYWGGGVGYAVPYYYPFDDASAYGYDYVGGGGSDMYSGPPLYSGPPVNPNDQTLHIIVEQPPAKPYAHEDDADSRVYTPPVPPLEPPAVPDAKPGEPTVLVYRDGHRQEVTNYAIMGDTLYVLDTSRKKIALADLDVPATIKANDDQGLDFRIPPTPKKKSIAIPQTTAPTQDIASRPNMGSAVWP